MTQLDTCRHSFLYYFPLWFIIFYFMILESTFYTCIAFIKHVIGMRYIERLSNICPHTMPPRYVCWKRMILFFYKFIYFIYLFLAVLGLHCSPWASHCGGFSCCRARGIGAWASVVVACGFWSAGSVVVVHGLSCSTACVIFPDQGLNPCPLHWQADS